MNKIKIIYFTPVVIVLIFLIFLFQLLNKDVKKLSSALIEKPVPEFEMQTLYSDITLLNSNDINSSNVALVNVWASWCIPCRAEHEILMLLSKIEGLDLYHLNLIK